MQPWELNKLEDTKELMLDDMRRLLKIGPVSRNYYRAHGRFQEKAWSYFWPTFRAFVRAAQISER